MCLVVLAWRMHPRYPLVVAANRDELHARPAAPLARWPDPPGMVAGRDLEAGGTWLGVDPRGRVGIVTNFRERVQPRGARPSRGSLIPRFLGGGESPGEYLTALEADADDFAGFNVLLVDATDLWYASNRSEPFTQRLEPGLYGLANHQLDTPWPKLIRSRDRLGAWLQRASGIGLPAALSADALRDPAIAQLPGIGELFDILSDREPSPPTSDPRLSTGLPGEWERAASAPFVLNPAYGTRCSTIVLRDLPGRSLLAERTFAPDGTLRGETCLIV